MIYAFTLDGETCELDTERVKISEGRECEALTGLTWLEFREQLSRGQSDALALAWWMAKKRSGNPCEGRFADLDFDLGDMGLQVREPEPDPKPAGTPDEGDAMEAPGPTSPNQKAPDGDPPSTKKSATTAPRSPRSSESAKKT